MSEIDFKKLAHQLMFDLSDEEEKDIKNEFDTLIAQLDLMDAVDTENVEPMIYCFEDATTFVRKDEVNHVLTKQEALSNAPKQRDGHFLVPRVVK